MFLIVALFLSSLLCLLISLLALGLVFKHIRSHEETFQSTDAKDAIVISGCDSGIGFELAKHFYKTCKFKIICGFLNIDQSEGFKRLSELSRDDVIKRMILMKLDLRSEKDVDNLIARIDSLKSEGHVKNLLALINNAGVMTFGEFDWLTWDHIQSQINVNLIGTLRLTRAVVPHIIESRGRVINVSSVNDTTVFPGLSVYSATKSALSTFSRGLGYELRKFGAHVVTVRLGDFAKLTNIMSSHATHKDDMWNEMSDKKRAMYQDFFDEFNRHLMKNYGMSSPREFEQSSLFRDFDRALLAKNPPTTITCAPLGFKIFYFVIELTPVWVQYYLLDLLMEYGFRWKPPRVEKTRL